ncbi:MAG TPA: hypothetical protein VEY30_08025, partial [Myxococcaceae bacterium]|nr:hypothetical protein [Myxococcaceae bacterium]
MTSAPARRSRADRPTSARSTLTAVSLVGAAALCAVVYAAATSLPYFAESPTTDPHFGSLNACLLQTLKETRLGFAVSADAALAAVYGGSALAACGGRGEGRHYPFRGIAAAAFDGEGGLWVTTARDRGGAPGLWRLPPGEPLPAAVNLKKVGELKPLALAGHRDGVVVLDDEGRLLFLNASGSLVATTRLLEPPSADAPLAVSAGERWVALAAG